MKNEEVPASVRKKNLRIAIVLGMIAIGGAAWPLYYLAKHLPGGIDG